MFAYFFKDFDTRIQAPLAFVTQVVCNLDVALYEPGEVIVPYGFLVEDLVMI